MATEIELENHGVRVEYAIGQYADTDEGRLLKGLVSEFAEYERSKIRRRTHNGKLRSVQIFVWFVRKEFRSTTSHIE